MKAGVVLADRCRVRFLFLLIALAFASPAAGQVIELRGRGDPENDAFLRRVIAAGGFQLIASDTLLGRNDTIPTTAVVAGATMRLEGVIAGDLIIVDANVFIRPTARVLGSIRNISGGLFFSELAEVGGTIRSDPNAPYRVEHRDDRVVVQGTYRESVLLLYGIMGLQAPTYDRVDGLTLSAAAGYVLPRAGLIEPIIRGRVDWRSRRGAVTGGLELAAARRRTELAVGAERTTVTNERWIRGDFDNTINALLLGRDERDYYGVDRAWVELRREVEHTSRITNVFLRGQVEDARSLGAGDPWSLFGDFRSGNMDVPESRISSAIAGTRSTWTLAQHAVAFTGAVEAGVDLFDSDHTFYRFEADLTWAMAALANHTLTIDAYVRGPIATDSLPPQRWSFLGGPATLPTFDIAAFRGDRVAFVETEYSIPLPAALRVRFLGRPYLDLLHMAGMAWSQDERPPLEQNVGARLRFSIVYVRAVANPRNFSDDIDLTVGLQFPRRAYPWQLGQ